MDEQGRFTIPVDPVITHKVYDSSKFHASSRERESLYMCMYMFCTCTCTCTHACTCTCTCTCTHACPCIVYAPFANTLQATMTCTC